MRYSKSFRDFLYSRREDSKIAALLHECVWLESNGHRAHKLAVTNQFIDYLTFRQDGTISFLPAGKEHIENEDGTWSREGRQNGKPSRVIRKILTPKAQKLFKDADFECFARHYQAKCEEDFKRFEVLPNDKIPEVYCMRLEDGHASLSGSCMNGDRDYLEFYTAFNVDILCMFNTEDRLAGRALLWRLPDGRTFMDRVYVAKDHYFEMFIEYARDQENWFWKKYYKSWDYKNLFVRNEGEFSENIRILLKDPNGSTSNYDYFPYIDTLSYGDERSINNYGDGDYEYNQTGGTRGGDIEYEECAISGREYDRDQMSYVDRGEHRDGWVHDDYAITVNGYTWTTDDVGYDIIEVNGNYYHKDSDEIAYLENEDEWVEADEAVYCDRDHCYYRTDDCVEDYEGNWILKTEAYEVNGDYYHESIVNKVA